MAANYTKYVLVLLFLGSRTIYSLITGLAVDAPLLNSNWFISALRCTAIKGCKTQTQQQWQNGNHSLKTLFPFTFPSLVFLGALKREQRGAFFSPLVRNGEDTVVLLFCCPVFFSSFIQSCKAAVWCHQSQSVCTSCTALIGCNDLRMSLHTLICFSLWPICFPILPRAAGCLPMDTQAGSSHAPFTLHYLTILCNHPASSPSLLSALWLLLHTGITYIRVEISSTVHFFFFFLLESVFVKKRCIEPLFCELLMKAVICWPVQKRTQKYPPPHVVACSHVDNKVIFCEDKL